MIRKAAGHDVEGWVRLAREVEPLFGPMVEDPGFRDALAGAIDAGIAWCVTDGGADGPAGIVVVDPEINGIEWLAVGSVHRGKGYGRALISHAVSVLDRTRDVRVQTFAPGIAEGEAARKLYLGAGFIDVEDAGKNPAGIETVIMVLRR